MGRESEFQKKLKKELKTEFPDCIILKNDPSDMRGIPDLLILYEDKWASLENKRSAKSKHQPNQDYYVYKMNGMSFSRFVYPENKDEVMKELKAYFED